MRFKLGMLLRKMASFLMRTDLLSMEEAIHDALLMENDFGPKEIHLSTLSSHNQVIHINNGGRRININLYHNQIIVSVYALTKIGDKLEYFHVAPDSFNIPLPSDPKLLRALYESKKEKK